jgi:hypothetical protein
MYDIIRDIKSGIIYYILLGAGLCGAKAPHPNNPNQVESFDVKTDFDLQGDGLVWYALPQLFSTVPCVPQEPRAH